MNAWLLTWEGTSSKITDENRIIGIISARRSDSFVVELIEFVYSRNTASAVDMAYFANRPKKKPFQAEKKQIINGVPHEGRIICGDNPWIYARTVKELEITEYEGIESVTWQEPDNYRWKDKGRMEIEVQTKGASKRLDRSTEHRLSLEIEAINA